MNILHLDSSILGGNSITRSLGRRLADRLAAELPNAQLSYRDLAANPIPHLTGEFLAAQAANARDGGFADEIALAEEVMAEFLAADILIIGAPMYNFSISSQLKAWIDRIAVAGKTFAYSPNGPVGLAGGKKVFILSGRGSTFVAGSPVETWDFQEPYLRAALAFVGISDVTFIRAEGVARTELREEAIAAAHAEVDALEIAFAEALAA
jgi:FMN-dependent NADH-azoreductase